MARFPKVGQADVDSNALRAGIEEGSYKVILPMMALAAGLASDVALGTWVRVEKYPLGQVIDLGGKKPNVHLQRPMARR